MDWNSWRPLVFAYMVLTRALGARKAREIYVRIDHQLDLWERGIQAGHRRKDGVVEI